MAEPPQANRWAVLSFRLGICSLFLGPLTGIPAILLGWLGLRDVRRSAGQLQGTGLARFGMLAGFAGTALVTWCMYAMATELIWPSVGKRVDRIFWEVKANRLYERQDGFWPTLRAIAPEGIYRAVENRVFPFQIHAISHRSIDFATGRMINFTGLYKCVEPIIAMGKPAVPHLLKWVTHDDIQVRAAAVYALEKITGKNFLPLGTFAHKDPEHLREKTIRMWQEWYDNQP